MSVTNYSDLKTALVAWLHRADITTSSDVVDEAIDLTEAWASRNLRTRWQAQEATAAATQYMALPTDFMAMRSIEYQASPQVSLEYVSPEYADKYDQTDTASTPRYYTIVGNQIRLIPPPSSSTTVRMAYWKSVPALTASSTTNWLITNFPDFYLWGGLMNLLVFVEDVQKAQVIQSNWARIVSEIQREGRRSQYGGALRVRAA